MRYYPHGFAVDCGLRLASVWEPIGAESRLVASTRLNPGWFQKARWLDAGDAVARAILFDWREHDTIH